MRKERHRLGSEVKDESVSIREKALSEMQNH